MMVSWSSEHGNGPSRADRKREALRAGLANGTPVVAVGAHDAMSARLIEAAGFDAVWVSGFGVSAMAYGLPDLNLVTMSETLDVTRRIEGVTTLPVVVDCDNGYGGFSNVVRTVVEFDRAGVAAVCIEDNLSRSGTVSTAGRRSVSWCPSRSRPDGSRRARKRKSPSGSS
jgi:2-methylisocitrate lyase-like PEP mutase family enzyme